MADELQYYGDPVADTGLTVLARVYNLSGVQVGSDVATTEAGALAIYRGNMPVAVEGNYGVRFFSGTILLGQSEISWDGAAERTILGNATPTNVSDAQTAIVTEINANEAKIDLIETKAQADARQAILIAEHDATQAALITTGQIRTELATELGRIDVAVSSRNATAPDNAGITAIKAKTDQLNFTGTDVQSIASNMRGTDSAITSLTPVTDAITALNDLSAAQVATELATYDAPTKAELDSAVAGLASQSSVNLIETKIEADARQALLIAEHDATQAALITTGQIRTELATELAEVTAIKAKTDQMNFTGSDIQSVASNMRGTDSAITSLTPVTDAITAQTVDLKGASDKDLTQVFDNTPSVNLTPVTDALALQDIEIAEIKTQSTLARKHLTNRDKIDTTAKTLIRYDDDGTTPLVVFDLKNSNGDASSSSIFEKVPQ